MGGDELEMLDHRVAGKAELAGDLEAFIARRHGSKGDTGVHHMLLDAVEAPEKIEMPPGAAEFAVGDRLQANLFLLLDDAANLAVLDFFQLLRRDLALGALFARLFQGGGAQQAADMIGTKRRLCTLRHIASPYPRCHARESGHPAITVHRL